MTSPNKHLSADVQNAINEAEKSARKILHVNHWVQNGLTVYASIIAPLMFSVIFTYKSGMGAELYGWLVTLLAITTLASVYYTITTKPPSNPLFLLQDMLEQVENERVVKNKIAKQNIEMRESLEFLDSSIEATTLALTFSLAELREAIGGSAVPSTQKEYKAGLKKILTPLSKNLPLLYGTNASKLMLTLYFWDKKSERLYISFRRKVGSIHEQNRSWGRREGFAGQVFSTGDFIIENDINNVKTRTSFSQLVDADNEYYHSVIGVPVLSTNDYMDRADPLGVLVLTSNEPNTFNDAVGNENRHESLLVATARLASIYVDFLDTKMQNSSIDTVFFKEGDV